MKEIKQENIVNFVDSFLVGESELWVSFDLLSLHEEYLVLSIIHVHVYIHVHAYHKKSVVNWLHHLLVFCFNAFDSLRVRAFSSKLCFVMSSYMYQLEHCT